MKVLLFKRASSGKIQSWMIEVEGDSYRTHEGFQDKKVTISEWTRCGPKNEGKSNATTGEEQALKEAEAKIKKQKGKGWTENVSDIDSAAQKIKPMLAHKFLEYVEECLSWPHIALQFKYDGVRCPKVEKELYTRTGKTMYAVPHIKEEVNKVFSAGTGVSELDLDGELYNHELKDDFNQLTSIVRKQKPKEEDIQKSKELMEYHIYDFISLTQTFYERYLLLQFIFSELQFEYLHLAPTVFLDNSEGQITKEILYEYLTEYQSLGYEGMMIRNADSFYENKRTKNLLKWKEFEDDEFELIGIEEGRGNRAGMAAKVFCKDKRGEEFSAGLRGTMDYCRKLLIDKDKLIGKQVTIRYQNLTPERKVPRFGKMLVVRDYE